MGVDVGVAVGLIGVVVVDIAGVVLGVGVVVELLCNVLFTNGCTNWLFVLDPTNIVVSGGLGF